MGKRITEGPMWIHFGVDSEPLRVNGILESGSNDIFFGSFFFAFLFFDRKADSGKEEYRVETGGRRLQQMRRSESLSL